MYPVGAYCVEWWVYYIHNTFAVVRRVAEYFQEVLNLNSIPILFFELVLGAAQRSEESLTEIVSP